jgi:hypothetical protein
MAKVAAHGSIELEREARVLAELVRLTTTALVAPRLVASFPWSGLDVVVTSVLPTAGCADRELGPIEEEVLLELASLGDQLRHAVDGDGTTLAHGDFCAWNTARKTGRLAVWDWEWAHMGEPLEDWFHWQTQRLVHFGRASVPTLVKSALTPSLRLRRLCGRLGVPIDAAPVSLAASLRAGLARLGDTDSPGVALRREALALLEGSLL